MDILVWDDDNLEMVVRKRARTEEYTNVSIDCSSSNESMTVKYAEIPAFLHDSAFYKELSSDEDVIIPRKVYSAHDRIRFFPDFIRLMEVMTFWGVNTFPNRVIGFCQYCDRAKLKNILDNVIDEVRFLSELKEIFCHSTDDSLMSAIRRGRSEVVEYLTKYQTDNEKSGYIALAAYLGNMDYLRLLHQRQYAWTDAACVDAALQGHLNCLQYLHENGCAWNYQVYIKAASNQHWACFKYAAENGLPWNVEVAMRLAQWKESKMLLSAIKYGCPVDTTVVQEAVANGDADSVHILLNVDCPVPVGSCLVAAKGGYLECLILLHQHGASFDEEATVAAASADHLPCLQYLHEQGCPWDEKTTEEAAKYGRLGTLRYALENGCAYYDDIVATAAGAPSIDCLQYLIEEQGLFMGDDGKAFLTAIQYCKPQTVQYLIDQGCDIHNCSSEAQAILLHTDWTLAYLPQGDELLLECIQIALSHNWDIRKNGQALLDKVKRYATLLPQCFSYFQNEGYYNSGVDYAFAPVSLQAHFSDDWGYLC